MKRELAISTGCGVVSIVPMVLISAWYHINFGPALNIDGRLVTPVGNPLIEWMFFTAPFIVFLVAFVLQLSTTQELSTC
ncbi:MAG: hypothetical protein ACW99U_01875 [Candidatus Thorarchaeota archaeon]